jgi:hypothetical protein
MLFLAAVSTLLVAPSAEGMDSGGSKKAMPGLENFIKASNRISCGSEPHGKLAFETLKELGVNTVVSVDGAVPQRELAKAAGIRYVHIPVGYDGISQAAGRSLTRVVRETTGPIYIHCHHGRHRGPAAATLACRVEGTADVRRSIEIMVLAGTSRDYVGLWRDVKAFVVPDERVQLPPLVEVAPLESLTAAMSRVSRRLGTLKASSTAGFGSSATAVHHTSAHDALLLHEALHEASRNLSSDYNREFKTWLTQSVNAAKAVHDSLRSGSADTARRHFQALQRSCTQCHKTYRN